MRKKPDDICRKVALIHGVSPRYVRMIRDGERENEFIFTTVMDFVEGEKKLFEDVKMLAEQDRVKAQMCKPCVYPLKKD